MNLLEEEKNNDDDTFKPGDGIELGQVGAHLLPLVEREESSEEEKA